MHQWFSFELVVRETYAVPSTERKDKTGGLRNTNGILLIYICILVCSVNDEVEARGHIWRSSMNPLCWISESKRSNSILKDAKEWSVIRRTPSTKLLVEDHGRCFIETAEQETKWSGMLEHIAVSYEKYVVLIISLKQRYALITLEKDVPAQSYTGVCKAIRALD